MCKLTDGGREALAGSPHRAEGPHQAHLFDIDAKYGDVVPSADVTRYLASIAAGGDFAAKAQDDFQRWWNRDTNAVA